MPPHSTQWLNFMWKWSWAFFHSLFSFYFVSCVSPVGDRRWNFMKEVGTQRKEKNAERKKRISSEEACEEAFRSCLLCLPSRIDKLVQFSNYKSKLSLERIFAFSLVSASSHGNICSFSLWSSPPVWMNNVNKWCTPNWMTLNVPPRGAHWLLIHLDSSRCFANMKRRRESHRGERY